MALKPQKKGPRSMKTAYRPGANAEVSHKELEGELNSFFKKVHGEIQKARSKMTDEEVERADREADSILKAASEKTKPARHSA